MQKCLRINDALKKDAACNGPAPFTSFHLFLSLGASQPLQHFLVRPIFWVFHFVLRFTVFLSVLSRISSGGKSWIPSPKRKKTGMFGGF